MTEPADTTPIDNNRVLEEAQATHQAFELLRAELQPSNKAILFDALAAAGITHIFVDFDVYGDSGQIESIKAEADGSEIAMPEIQIEIAEAKFGQAEPERLTVSLAEAVDQIAYDFLEQTHAGWENNEGAYGTFTFDVVARTATLSYNERYVESEYSEHVF